MKKIVLFLLSMFFFGMQIQSFAAEQAPTFGEGLETLLLIEIPVCTIATKTEMKISNAPSVVSVISASQIKAMGAKTLSDVMNTVPGVYFGLPANRAGFGNGYLRGVVDISKIKFLINGIPMNENLQNYPGSLISYGSSILDWVDRIEIIRGPGSVIYGDYALLGVINIITKTHSGGEINLSGGSNNSKKGFVRYNHGDEKDFNVNVMATIGGFDFPKATIGSNYYGSLQTKEMKLSQFQSKNILLSLSYRGWTLENVYMDETSKNPFGAGEFFLTEDSLSKADIYTEYSSLKKNIYLNDLVLNSKIFFRKITWKFNAFHITPPGVPSSDWPNGMYGKPYEYSTNSWFGQFDGVYSGLENNEIIAGLEYMNDDHKDMFLYDNMSNPNLFTPLYFCKAKTRKLSSIYIGDTFSGVEKISVNFGTRYDYYSDIGEGSTNPRIALVYTLTDEMNLKAIYSTAFRPPNTGNETGNPDTSPNLLNNPDLIPEKLKTYEFALDYRPLNRLNLTLNYYHNQLDDMIKIVESPEPGKSWAVNIGKQTSWGIESEIKYGLNETNNNYIFSNVAWLGESKNTLTGKDLPYVPKVLFNVGLNYKFYDKLNVLTKAFYRSKLEPEVDDWRGVINSFWLFDTTFTYAINSSDIYLSVKNIFDKEWKDVEYVSLDTVIDHVPGPGRTFEAGYRYSF